MSNKCFVVPLVVGVSILSGPLVFGASLADMFGGKKAQENKALIEQKEQECQTKLGEKDAINQRLSDENREVKSTAESFQAKNATLMEAYEKLKTEHENVVEQITRFRRESQRCDEIKANYEQMSRQNETFLQQKESSEQKAETIANTLANLKQHIKEVTDEKDRLAVFLAEAQENEDVKVKKIRNEVKAEVEALKAQVAALTKDNGEQLKTRRLLEENNYGLDQKNMELARQIGSLQDEINAMKQQYTDLRMENRSLMDEATTFPRKFTDLARHNRKLINETADMHYNLGVSHIKNKDYKRAIKEFEKVLELKPEDPEANYNLGYIYAEHLVDRERAMKYFQDYLSFAPDAKDADWVRKYMLTWQAWYGKKGIK